jgi:hypothetical protein
MFRKLEGASSAASWDALPHDPERLIHRPGASRQSLIQMRACGEFSSGTFVLPLHFCFTVGHQTTAQKESGESRVACQ